MTKLNNTIVSTTNNDDEITLEDVKKLTNRRSALQTKDMLVERIYHWNQMRRTKSCYAATRKLSEPSPLFPETQNDLTQEEFREILNAYKWHFIDQVYWYIRQTVNDMGIGVLVDVKCDEENETLNKSEIIYTNGVMNIIIRPRLQFEAHTFAFITLTKEETIQFYSELIHDLYDMLIKDGYMITGPGSGRNEYKYGRREELTRDNIDAMSLLKQAFYRIQWTNEIEVNKMEKILFDSQYLAYLKGCPLDDITLEG